MRCVTSRLSDHPHPAARPSPTTPLTWCPDGATLSQRERKFKGLPLLRTGWCGSGGGWSVGGGRSRRWSWRGCCGSVWFFMLGLRQADEHVGLGLARAEVTEDGRLVLSQVVDAGFEDRVAVVANREG